MCIKKKNLQLGILVYTPDYQPFSGLDNMSYKFTL